MLAFRKISNLFQRHVFLLLFDLTSTMKPLYSAHHPFLYQKAFHESGGQLGAPTHTSFIFSAGMGGIVLALMLFAACRQFEERWDHEWSSSYPGKSTIYSNAS